MKYKNSEGGFIKTVVMIIITIVLLVYFEDSIRKFLESEQAKQAIGRLLGISQFIWEHYLRAPIMFVWDKVIIDILWEQIIKTAIEYLNNLKK